MSAATPATRARLGYLPALDGLRALAIVLVVVHHAEGIDDGIFEFGVLGVDVFFVLSGFLITALIAEQIQSGAFRRRRFYARRAIRLVPALLVMVVLLTPLAVIVTGRGALVAAAAALLYVTPIVTGPVFGHTWTLAFEEWFYLLWPIVLAKFFRDRLTMRQCAALVGAFAAMSQAFMIIAPGSIAARPSALLIGCALALWWLDGGRIPRPAAALIAGVSVIAFGVIAGPTLWGPLPYWSAITGSALAIGAVASGGGGPVAHVLRSLPMVAVGVVSYEWYLLHFPMLQMSEEEWGVEASLWVAPLSLVAAFALHYALAPLQARLRGRLADAKTAPPPRDESIS